MKIIFFGNTRFSLIGAKIIHQTYPLSMIVTLPDRPDKKGTMQPNPLKTFALEQNIPFLLVDKITPGAVEKIVALQPDFLVVEDYGLILPEKLLTLPKYACLNIHHSLLPKYRGTSPAPYAILSGEKATGVTVIKMNERIDAGDILAQAKYEMSPNETTESLLTKLNEFGGKIIIPVMNAYAKGEEKSVKQDESKATYTKRMSKIDGQIDINNPPQKSKLDRMIRAYFPWPNVWTRLKINGREKIVKLLPDKRIQVEGGKPMSVKDFLNGYPELKSIVEILSK